MSSRVGTAARLLWSGLAGTVLGLIGAANWAEAKTPGHTYCFLSVCHRVLTLAETRAAIGKPRSMHASHYDDPSRDRFNPSLITSSGELFRPDAPNNAASPIYPDGTLVAVFAPTTKRGAIVRINNAGPYYGNRMIDLSRGLAHKLGIGGVGRVIVEILAEPRPQDAVYARGRKYPPVAGFIGKVAGVEDVREQWRAGQAPRNPVIAQGGGQAPAMARAAAASVEWVPFESPSPLSEPSFDRHLSVARVTTATTVAALTKQPEVDTDAVVSLPAASVAPVAMVRRVPLVAAREARPQAALVGYPRTASAAPLELDARSGRRTLSERATTTVSPLNTETGSDR